MQRRKAAPPGEESLAAAVDHRHETLPPARGDPARRARGRPERVARDSRLRGAAPRGTARAVPIRPTVLRRHRLFITGELGQQSAASLEAEIDALCEAEVDELVLDLGGLRGIDATGARVLAMRRELCRRRGVHVELAGVDAEVRRAFLAAGLDEPGPPVAGDGGDGTAALDENAQMNDRKLV